MKNKQNYSLQEYQQAVWDYMLEHSDITKSGKYFIKFHTNSKTQFQGHVLNRCQGYHREDPIAKEVVGVATKHEHLTNKLNKKYTYKVARQKRFAAIKLVEIINKSPKWCKPILNYYGKNIRKVF